MQPLLDGNPAQGSVTYRGAEARMGKGFALKPATRQMEPSSSQERGGHIAEDYSSF